MRKGDDEFVQIPTGQPMSPGYGYPQSSIPMPVMGQPMMPGMGQQPILGQHQQPMMPMMGAVPGQPQPGYPGVYPPPPNLLSGIDPNLAAQFGMAYGTQALAVGQNYLNSNINRYIDLPTLKYYFDVNNSYVIKKLSIVLCPFKKTEWERTPAKDGQAQRYFSPRDDINAPDLYIPVMSFITFVLLVAVEMGRKRMFTPEVLGVTSTTGVIVSLLEIVYVKVGCYLLNINSDIAFLDLVSYTGYKYVGMVVSELAEIVLGFYGYLIAFIYCSFALMLFTLRTLSPSLSADGSYPGAEISAPKKRRNYFLLSIAAVQIAAAWLLV